MEFWIKMGISYPQSGITETFKIYCMGGILKKCFGLHDSTGMVSGGQIKALAYLNAWYNEGLLYNISETGYILSSDEVEGMSFSTHLLESVSLSHSTY
jgi:hypothetical protein